MIQGGKLRLKSTATPPTPAEKLKYVIEERFTYVELHDLEKIETATARGDSLDTAIQAITDNPALVADECEEDAAKSKEEYAAELKAALELKAEAQSNERLEALYEQSRKQARARDEAARERARALSEERSFFNKESAKADYEVWADVDELSLEEAVALSLGREPKAVNTRTLKPLSWTQFARRFGRILDLAERAKRADVLKDPGTPEKFLEWARKKGIECDPRWQNALAVKGRETVDWEGRYKQAAAELADAQRALDAMQQENTPLNGKVRQTFYKIIYLSVRRDDKLITDKEMTEHKRRVVEKARRLGLTADDEPVATALKDALAFVNKKLPKL